LQYPVRAADSSEQHWLDPPLVDAQRRSELLLEDVLSHDGPGTGAGLSEPTMGAAHRLVLAASPLGDVAHSEMATASKSGD